MDQTIVEQKLPPNQICFHVQQTAEKYLKGFLVLKKREFEKSHQLRYLVELCIEIDAAFEELRSPWGSRRKMYCDL